MQSITETSNHIRKLAAAMENVINGLRDIAQQVQHTKDSSESQASATTQNLRSFMSVYKNFNAEIELGKQVGK